MLHQPWPRWRLCFACVLLALLTACSGTKKGGYYKDDGPEANPPSNLDKVPDAIPKIEPLASGANKPYNVFGRSYTPDVSGGTYKVQGRASWYGKKFHGNPTSNGERYDMYAMTAAHTTLPIPSYVRVTRVANGKSVVLRVNDRGPFHSERIIDLSYVAAYKLGMLGPGSTEVVVERIMPDQIRNWTPQNSSPLAEPSPSSPVALPVVAASASAPTIAVAELPAVNSRSLPASGTPEMDSRPQPASMPPDMQQARAVPAGAMFLQFGAFSDLNKAQALASQIKQKIPSELNALVLVDRSTTNLYRVRIGPFASRDAATQALAPVQNSTGLAPSLALP